MTRMIARVLLLSGAAALTTTTMKGQQATAAPSHALHQEVDLAFTVSPEHSTLNTGSSFWRQGGAFELSAEAYQGLGVAMSVAGSQVSNINGTGIDLTTVTTTFGPRYTHSFRSEKMAAFGQALLGESHGMDSVFPSPSGAQTDSSAFALQLGGGLDVHLSHRLAARAIQADWIRTQFANGTTNTQNSLRIGAGIVLRLGS